MRIVLACLAALGLVTAARAAEDPPRPPALATVAVPEPADLDQFVRDRDTAIALGKALFWDMQVGSDGVVACATCHFRAGADPRSRNQLAPGLARLAADGTPDPDRTFAAPLGPNRRLVPGDFPLWPRSNDVVGSAGVVLSLFEGLTPRAGELLRIVPDGHGFAVNGTNVRRVTGRNAPSVINAVFNDRQFWDGRAQPVFNGVNAFGDLDPDARVWRADDPRAPVPVRVRLEPASLASQAVAPVLNPSEMSAEGRTFRHVAARFARGPREIGGRIRTLRPLAGQLVHPDDSVLGALSRWPERGLLVPRYEQLVQRAFHPVWWKAARRLREAPDGTMSVVRTGDGDPATDEMTLLQANFPLFFGIAIQLYESTLVADDTPWDRFMAGDASAVGPDALRGADLFRSQTRGRCINCHEGAELTGASVRRVRESPTRIREGQAMDRGFNNVGAVPTREDPGVGGSDPFGNPLSTVRRLPAPPPQPIAVDGAVKVPGLRNVELTAPYFHTGGLLTLRDVLLFYSRGGDVRPQWSADGALEIAPLAVLENDDAELAALEAFLRALTDERVRWRRAPFDHPQLFVPDGHPGDQTAVADDGSGRALDRLTGVPAVGRDGGPPLPGFLED